MYVKTGLKIIEVSDSRGTLRVVTVARVQANGNAFKVEGDSATYSTKTGDPYGGAKYPFMRNMASDETPESIAKEMEERQAEAEATRQRREAKRIAREQAALRANPDKRPLRLMTEDPALDVYQFTVVDNEHGTHTVMFIETYEDRFDYESDDMQRVLVGKAVSLHHGSRIWNKFEVEARTHEGITSAIICALW